jgi:hypothetical protein
MSASLWVGPAVVSSLVAILWIATRLERLVVPPVLGPELQIPEAAATELTDATASQETLGTNRQLSVQVNRAPS